MVAAVTGNIHCQFEAAPDAQLVEGAAQMIFHDLFGSSRQVANLAIRQPPPNEAGNLDLFAG